MSVDRKGAKFIGNKQIHKHSTLYSSTDIVQFSTKFHEIESLVRYTAKTHANMHFRLLLITGNIIVGLNEAYLSTTLRSIIAGADCRHGTCSVPPNPSQRL